MVELTSKKAIQLWRYFVPKRPMQWMSALAKPFSIYTVQYTISMVSIYDTIGG
jgi:hypothetical protein